MPGNIINQPVLEHQPVPAAADEGFLYLFSFQNPSGGISDIYIRAKDEKEANEKFKNAIGLPEPPQSCSIEEFVNQYYRPNRMQSIRPTTRSTYEQYLKNIYKYFGNMPLNRIDKKHIQEYFDWRGKELGCKNGTSERINGFLKGLFDYAVAMGVIAESPYSKIVKIRFSGPPSHHHKAIPEALYQTIYRSMESSTNRNSIVFAALLRTNMRLEEIFGLKWQNIDFKRQSVSIVQAVTYPNRNTPVIGSPKTPQARRTIPVIAPVLRVLSQHKQGSGFIFGGNMPVKYGVVKGIITSTFKEMQLDGYTSHDFRVTFATRLRESGMFTDAEIAGVLGHKDTRLIHSIYAPPRHETIMKLGPKLDDAEQHAMNNYTGLN